MKVSAARLAQGEEARGRPGVAVREPRRSVARARRAGKLLSDGLTDSHDVSYSQCSLMSPKDRSVTIRLDPPIAEAMEAMRLRYGTPLSEQVRRALVAWLTAEGFMETKADRKRGGARKRP